MPNVEAIKYKNSTLSPIRTDKITECNPRQLVKTETKNEHEVLVRIPGEDFMAVLPNVSDHTQLHDRLYFKWYWKNHHGRHWIVIKIRHGPMRTRHTPIWWTLQRLRTNLAFHPYYITPPYLRTNNITFSYTFYREHCEDHQWNQRMSNALLNPKITFSHSKNVQCWRYNNDPQSCVERSRTYCNQEIGLKSWDMNLFVRPTLTDQCQDLLCKETIEN